MQREGKQKRTSTKTKPPPSLGNKLEKESGVNSQTNYDQKTHSKTVQQKGNQDQ